MLNNKKVNKIVYTMIGATLVSGGLFAYQQFYLNNQNDEQIIYVAKQDIPNNTEIKEDMLEAVTVPKDGVLSTYVTNVNDVLGKSMSGGLLKDEPLSKARLINSEDTKNILELKIDYDNEIPLNNNDYINIYVILTNNSGETVVQKLFERKLVTVTTVTTSDSTSSYYTLKVTEEEALNYYTASETGKLVVVKDKSLDGSEDITLVNYDRESDEAKNAVTPSENTDGTISIVSKTFGENDTLENLAIKYKTNVDTIKKLNNDKTEFKVGDVINLPAN